MKIATLILAILGALASLALGIKWLSDASGSSELLSAAAALGADMAELNAHVRAAYLLVAGGVFAIAASVLTMKNKGVLGGILLLLAVIAPAVFAPETLIATFLLVIAAGLAFFSQRKVAAIPATA